MKRSLLMIFAAASFVGVSCERHEFDGKDGTRRLHEHHSSGEHAQPETGGHQDAPEPSGH